MTAKRVPQTQGNRFFLTFLLCRCSLKYTCTCTLNMKRKRNLKRTFKINARILGAMIITANAVHVVHFYICVF